MMSKKYKILKSISTLCGLKNIFRNSTFFCFIEMRTLNSKELIILKQFFCSIGLRMYTSNNVLLKLIYSSNDLKKHLLNDLNYGNLVIFYFKNDLGLPLISSNVDLLLKNTTFLPLFFYFEKRFFYGKDFLNALKTSKIEAHKQLVNVLQYCSSNLQNKLALSISQFLFILNIKKF